MDYKTIKYFLNKVKSEKPKILVIGDIMLDQYVSGNVNRISPEAPVPILDFQNKEAVLGGAGNVVHNLINFGSEVSLATIIGDDLEGRKILDLLKNLNISADLISVSKNINTTKKTRFISQGTQLLRLDNDSKGFLDIDFDLFKKKIRERIESFHCIVISDYNKGVCNKSVIKGVIQHARKDKTPVFIDPKGSSWAKYMNATCLTPNTKEVEEQLNSQLIDDADFESAAQFIRKEFKLKYCLITRGSDGMTFSMEDKTIHQRVGAKEVFDVSGAGDTVIACIAASLSSGITLEDSLEFSGDISSEVVTHKGTVPFHLKML